MRQKGRDLPGVRREDPLALDCVSIAGETSSPASFSSAVLAIASSFSEVEVTPDRAVGVAVRELEARVRQLERGLERHLGRHGIDPQLHELQADRAVRHRDHAQRAESHDAPLRIGVGAIR